MHFLQLEEFGPHISNNTQLIMKMQKYHERFEEAIQIIDNPAKAKSCIILPSKNLKPV